MSGTVTISSSYGTDGALIGREVAERLRVSFFDRAIPVAVARELAIGTSAAMEMDWRAPGRMERFLAAMANMSSPYFAFDAQSEVYSNPDLFRQTTESVLHHVADGDGGVIIGRGSAVVLRERQDVLRVRLDGPVETRITQASQRRGVDETTIRSEQEQTDGAREAYMQYFYGASQYDAKLYHVTLDRTVLSRDICIEIVVSAAIDSLGMSES